MLRAGRMEEFVTEEEEPWYDQRDLEQGEGSVRCVVVSVSGEGWLVGWGGYGCCNNTPTSVATPLE